MALQSSFYFTDGTTRTFPSTKHIATKQHVAVYQKRVSDSLWEIASVDIFTLVNNSIVFDTAPQIVLYSQIEVRVADTANELEDSPSDIAIVAGGITSINTIATNIIDVNTVATNIGALKTVSANNSNIVTVSGSIANVNVVGSSIENVNNVGNSITNVNNVATTIIPNIAEILLADDNATIATAQALIATNKAAEAAASAASIDPFTLVHKDSSTGSMQSPAGTTAQRTVAPTVGSERWNTELHKKEIWDGSSWVGVGGGATGGGADTVFVETSYNVTTSYTITSGKSAMTVGNANGDVIINDGVTVTIPDTSVWVILGA